MAAPHSPIGARRRLGAELRRLRNNSGLTLDDVAEKMTCSTSKISRLETGKGIPKIPDVNELIRIYGVTSDTERDMLLRLVRDGREHGWWESLTEGVTPERYMMDAPGRYASLENDATAVSSFDLTVVPGLLQTERYMRTVITALFSHQTEEAVDQLVRMRMTRQEALFRDDPKPLQFTSVMDEAVLSRPIGGADVMAEQLERVLELAERPNISIRVLPFGAGFLRAHAGHFVLLGIPADLGNDVVYIEGHSGEAFLDSRDDVKLYREVFADALNRTRSGAASQEVIRHYLTALRKNPTGHGA
ncbi:helix-turn-helix transcriptional regulator [Actinomycetes bacterium KLBMP 9759]